MRLVLIQYLFGIRSVQQTIKEIETNTAYHWVIGDEITHFLTFGKNYVRRFADAKENHDMRCVMPLIAVWRK